jgi:hypothetical protein
LLTFLFHHYIALRKLFKSIARHWWLRPVILATWEAEIWRIHVSGQPRLTTLETPISMGKSQVQRHTPVIPVRAGSVKQEDRDLGGSGEKARPSVHNIQSKKGWRHGSNCRVPT